jgi:hypothetical protein
MDKVNIRYATYLENIQKTWDKDYNMPLINRRFFLDKNEYLIKGMFHYNVPAETAAGILTRITYNQ